MEGIDQFEQSFIVGQYECDCNGRMKAGALLSQTQAISTNHCNAIGWTIFGGIRRDSCGRSYPHGDPSISTEPGNL